MTDTITALETKETKKDVRKNRIWFRVSDTEHDLLKSIAAKRKTSVTELFRKALNAIILNENENVE